MLSQAWPSVLPRLAFPLSPKLMRRGDTLGWIDGRENAVQKFAGFMLGRGVNSCAQWEGDKWL